MATSHYLAGTPRLAPWIYDSAQSLIIPQGSHQRTSKRLATDTSDSIPGNQRRSVLMVGIG